MVFTHRRPSSCLASLAALLTDVGGLMYDNIDTYELGKNCVFDAQQLWRRAAAWRSAIPVEEQQKLIDVDNDVLRRDPIGVVKCIYKRAGIEFTDECEREMLAFIAKEKAKKYRNTYKMEEFGLTDEFVNAEMDFYLRARRRYLGY